MPAKSPLVTALAFPLMPEPDAASRKAGQRLFTGSNAAFLKGVVATGDMPDAGRIEVCFAGRSNVGKSSLINALTGRRGLARASGTPGRTQEINFFTLANSHFLVDLPGYGYARAPARAVARWQNLMKRYLCGRASLRRAFVLIDARHGIKPVDTTMMTLLDQAAVSFQVVLTKADKLSPQNTERVLAQVRQCLQSHPASFPEIAMTSSAKQQGLDALRSSIALLGLAPATPTMPTRPAQNTAPHESPYARSSKP